MEDDVKILHITVVDGTYEQIEALTTELKKIKEKLPYKVEFLVTNEKVQLESVKYLLEELIKLYKNYKALKEAAK
jgi:hypothetical protein